jgi:ATP-dependent DNA ligase
VFAKACELGLEGVVSKRAGSFYKSGQSRNWLETVNPDFVRT